MKVLIPRNTSIPVRKSDVFSTSEANQSSVEIHVLQGERQMAEMMLVLAVLLWIMHRENITRLLDRDEAAIDLDHIALDLLAQRHFLGARRAAVPQGRQRVGAQPGVAGRVHHHHVAPDPVDERAVVADDLHRVPIGPGPPAHLVQARGRARQVRHRPPRQQAARHLHGRSQLVGAGSLTLGWSPSCSCPPHEPVPCAVLDPFAGAGTTLLVADRLQRHGVGIELNPEYIAIAQERLRGDAPLFAEVA